MHTLFPATYCTGCPSSVCCLQSVPAEMGKRRVTLKVASDLPFPNSPFLGIARRLNWTSWASCIMVIMHSLSFSPACLKPLYTPALLYRIYLVMSADTPPGCLKYIGLNQLCSGKGKDGMLERGKRKKKSRLWR